MARSCQVAIIGGGPVGLGLALDLGLRGISCILLERRTRPHCIPKGQNLTQRTLEIFHSWGLAEQLRKARLIPPDHPGNFIVAYGDLASPYWYAHSARQTIDKYYSQKGERLPQYLTEKVLTERLEDFSNVSVRSGWAMESFFSEKSGVTVNAVHDHSGKQDTLRADFLVGCDGSGSLVRTKLGVPSSGNDYGQAMVLAVFCSRVLNDRLNRFPPAYIYRVVHRDLRGYWRFFGRVDDGERWFFHAPVPDDSAQDEDSVRRLLYQSAGFEFPCSFDHVGYWDLRFAVAESFRVGKVFIAGDAAHSYPPYGGFGLNTGFEDAANLGWKLSAVLDGWGGDTLLDSYSAERQAVSLETARDFIDASISRDRNVFDQVDSDREFEKIWTEHRETTRSGMLGYVPHYEGSPVIEGACGSQCGASGSHMFRVRAGHHLTPIELSDGRNVFKALGRNFTLLSLGGEDECVRRLETAARCRQVPMLTVRDIPSGRAHGQNLVLVRPDSFVAWADDRVPENAGALIGKVTGTGSGHVSMDKIRTSYTT